MRRSQKGQALIETALVLPVILTLMLGIFGFGRLFNAQLILTNASREGARVGALGQNDAAIRQTVALYLGGAGLADPAVNVAVARSIAPDPPDVKVDVVYPIPMVIDLPGIPNPIMLRASAIMRMEPNP